MRMIQKPTLGRIRQQNVQRTRFVQGQEIIAPTLTISARPSCGRGNTSMGDEYILPHPWLYVNFSQTWPGDVRNVRLTRNIPSLATQNLALPSATPDSVGVLDLGTVCALTSGGAATTGFE